MGLMKTLRRWTKPPKGSILRKVFGNSVLDELGTGLGFAVGGPLGAAVGSAAGHAGADNKHATLGGILKNGAKGWAAGQVGHMVGVPGNGVLAGPAGLGGGAGAGGLPPGLGAGGIGTGGLGAAGQGASAAGSGLPSMGDLLSRGGRFLGGVEDYFTDKDQGLQRTQMALGGLGAYGNFRAAAEEGRLADRQYEQTEEEKRRLREAAGTYGSTPYRIGG